ncbi:hypothetical protein BLA29_001546 [Euroglyphus maynei]|uniref:Uncharacterized protein n=1 Tax=Euroglyphus maynei TaxID=6958 RepID=A0A1Y3BE82_EURMA|nr:hypothetical protein BLA29_001546 [Euroglyphus maynei]
MIVICVRLLPKIHFNLIKQLLSIDEKELIKTFENYPFHYVRFIAEKQSFERLNTFVYDKNAYMKSMMDSIVHVSRLPMAISTTIVDLIEWIEAHFGDDKNSFYGVNVCNRNSDNNSIRSALIVLKNSDCVRILQEKINASGNNIRVVSYRDYLRHKNQSRMKRRRRKKSMIRQTFEKMAITNTVNVDESKTIKQQRRLHGIQLLVARRTIIMTGIPDPVAKLMMIQDENGGHSFKQYLQPSGLIFMYQPKSENQSRKSNESTNNNITQCDYYLFFKNRTSMLQLYDRLRKEEDPMKVFQSLFANNSLINNNNNNEWMLMADNHGSMITGKNFSLINTVDGGDLPRRFKHYVYCIRRFFQNHKAAV